MSFNPVAHTEQALGSSGGTTTGIDTTGADLIVVFASADGAYVVVTGATITDNKGNSYTALAANAQHNAGDVGSEMSWCKPTTVGPGHTFTIAAGSSFSDLFVLALSGSAASPYDQDNGHAASGTPGSIQPGSLTPSQNNCILIVGIAHDAASASIDSSFTKSGSDIALSGGAHYGGALFYKIQTTAGAENPTITASGAALATNMAVFKAAAGGGGGGPRFMLVRH